MLRFHRNECSKITQKKRRKRTLIKRLSAPDFALQVSHFLLPFFLSSPAKTPVFAKGSKVGILLENMGRINYGVHMFDSKRIELGIDGAKTGEWKNVSLPMTDLSTLRFTNISAKLNENAGFYKGTFAVDEPCDTFLRLDGFSKGFAMINGFNLGRYWGIGPQKSLYVPASLLKILPPYLPAVPFSIRPP